MGGCPLPGVGMGTNSQKVTAKRWTTQEVATEIGVSVDRLRYALSRGHVPRPARLDATTFSWTTADLERARRWFAANPGIHRHLPPREGSETQSEGVDRV